MSSGDESKIVDEIRELRGDLRVFITKLMGDEAQELPEGRIPRLEAGHKNLSRRVRRIESAMLMVAGALGLVKVLGWLLEAAHNFFSIAQHAQK